MPYTIIGDRAYDTAAGWVGQVMPANTICVATDTYRCKNGDGSTLWENGVFVLAEPMSAPAMLAAHNNGNSGGSNAVANHVSQPNPHSQYSLTGHAHAIADVAGLAAALAALSAPTVTTWALRPSASVAGVGAEIIVSDLGPKRQRWISDGTDWRPASVGILHLLTSNFASVTGTTEQILRSVALPSGLLPVGAILRISAAGIKSGTAETSTIRLRMGATGTTADAIVIAPTMATTVDGFGFVVEVKRVSATTVLRTGAGANTVLFPMGTSNATQTTAVTVANMDTLSNTLILTSQHSASVETTTINSFIIELIA